MEFKGTKGIWVYNCENSTLKKDDGNTICRFYYTNDINKKEVNYNGNLCSIAPEMLETLREELKIIGEDIIQ